MAYFDEDDIQDYSDEYLEDETEDDYWGVNPGFQIGE